jgi:hypothetical protein
MDAACSWYRVKRVRQIRKSPGTVVCRHNFSIDRSFRRCSTTAPSRCTHGTVVWRTTHGEELGCVMCDASRPPRTQSDSGMPVTGQFSGSWLAARIRPSSASRLRDSPPAELRRAPRNPFAAMFGQHGHEGLMRSSAETIENDPLRQGRRPLSRSKKTESDTL